MTFAPGGLWSLGRMVESDASITAPGVLLPPNVQGRVRLPFGMAKTTNSESGPWVDPTPVFFEQQPLPQPPPAPQPEPFPAPIPEPEPKPTES
jgi:hypothetical protein